MDYQNTSVEAGQAEEQANTPEWIENARREDAEKWLRRSLEAQDPQAALDYAQRAMDFLPDDPVVHHRMQQGILAQLKNDAFVAFLAETDSSYVIRFRDSRPIAISKTRFRPEVFPVEHATPGEHIFGLLRWMLVGLLPSGLGAAVFGPYVMWKGFDLVFDGRASLRDRRLALVTILVALPLTFIGLVFSLLLLLHVIG